jgi:outer membrane protein OmpA-like peptidoglycan-associated protein
MKYKMIQSYRLFAATVGLSTVVMLGGCTQAPAPIVDAGGVIGPTSDRTHGVDMGSGFSSEEISNMISDPGKYTDQQRSELAKKISTIMQKDDGDGNVVYYGFNQNSLSVLSKVKANAIAKVLLEYPDQHVRIAGNTDPIGSANYNFSLGQRRATALEQYLKSQGVSEKQICTVSYGSTRSVVDAKIMNGSRCRLLAGKPTATSACKKAFKSDRRAVVVFGGTCNG